MAIPLYNAPQEKNDPIQAARLNPGMALNNLGMVGQAVGHAADVIDHVQAQADTVVVTDAMNAATREALRLRDDPKQGYTNVLGGNVLYDASGKPYKDQNSSFSKDKLTQFKQAIDASSTKLTNANQMKIFKARAQILENDFYDGLMRHESNQLQSYSKSVIGDSIKEAISYGAKDWSNPTSRELAQTMINGAMANLDRLNGTQSETTRKALISQFHSAILTQALTSEKKSLAFADTYFKNNQKEMDLNDVLKYQAEINKETKLAVVSSGISTAKQEMTPRFDLQPVDTLMNAAGDPHFIEAIKKVESGGNKNAVSPKGATGEMQVMPDTAAKPGFGIKPSNGTPDDTARVGREYFGAMLKEFNGDVKKALAAYNAGPGAVQNAVSNSPVDDPDAWLKALPEETQAYVPKVLKAYQGGTAKPRIPTESEFINTVLSRVGDDPETRTMAQQRAIQEYGILVKSNKEREDNAISTAFKILDQNPDYDALPMDIRGQIPGDEIGKLRDYAAKRKKGEPVVTNLALYQKLTTDQAYLQNLSDQTFFALRSDLSDADFKHFSQERMKLRTGEKPPIANDIKTAEANQIINNRLSSLGIDPTPKDTNKDELIRVGTVRKTIFDAIQQEQKDTGTRLEGAKLTTFIDGLFANRQELKTGILLWKKTETPSVLAIKPKDIPEVTRKAIEQDFKARGVTPTESEVFGAFLRLRTTKRVTR